VQNPPILTVTGTRRPHDRAGAGSVLHTALRFLAICENRVVDCNTVTGENVWRLRRAEPANKRQTRGMPPARSRPACGLPLGARVVFRDCSGVARSEACSDSSQVYS
jgi:hypothetical protein